MGSLGNTISHGSEGYGGLTFVMTAQIPKKVEIHTELCQVVVAKATHRENQNQGYFLMGDDNTKLYVQRA